MQFYDEVKISIESGKGGDGIASGRRESGVPFGGPSGGDGGKGGSIVFVANKDENTLLEYKYKKVFKAKAGEPGRTKDQYGANAEEFYIPVPVGTLIKDAESNRLLHHFTQDKEERVALLGGAGGKGNIHFKDAVNQYPNFYLLGEPGQKRELILELQLFGDVGLIGNPSVGKSSLINCVSATKAKVADYPFTTLVPNLGSVSVGDFRFNMVDIPGLIEGAAEGKGLGNAFLRHILKSRVFCFVADLARFDTGIDETISLFDEIMLFIQDKYFPDGEDIEFSFEEDQGMISFIVCVDGDIFMKKRVLFVFNKYDLINDEEILLEYQKQFHTHFQNFLTERNLKVVSSKLLEQNTFVTSAGTFHGIGERLRKLSEVLKQTEMKDFGEIEVVEHDEDIDEGEDMVTDITEKTKQYLIDHNYIEEATSRYAKVWFIKNPEICKLVFITPWGNEEAEMRFWKSMEQRGFLEIFETMGVRKGDIFKIKSYYHGEESRFILY